LSIISEVVRNVASILPEVRKPKQKITLTNRLFWTALALVTYLVMAQVPLYGVAGGMQDQQSFTQIIFASSAQTLMHLGIGPIVTAGLILQLLKGAEIIKLDFKKPDDRALFAAGTKMLAILVTFAESVAFMIGGSFGTGLPTATAIVIIIQLLIGGIMVILLDELVQKGWGLGSGISLFIAAGVAQSIFWNTFSLVPAGQSYFGVIPHVIANFISGSPESIFFRPGGLPSVVTLSLTLVVIGLVVYAEGIRVEIPITSTKYRGFQGTYPIKLLYVSVLPVILTGALLANIVFFSQMVWSRFNPTNANSLLNLLGTYNTADPGAGPIGGFAYYVSPPRGLEVLAVEPVRALTYVLFYVVMCTIFARIWVEIGGLGAKSVAQKLLGANVQVPGFRRSQGSVEIILERYIPVITVIGGILMGLLASGADILGIFGGGTGLLLMVSITLNYYEILMKERLETMMPGLASFLGK
jgi:preprotein translocase SecY subunit|tara:strand:- start:6852 stop:8261 length:1410 start_codon:yes stop_codon:yes gene_type:complete